MADEVFDFIIVGSGGGSMCAALAVKALGKSPLILEKTDLIGGTTARSGEASGRQRRQGRKPASWAAAAEGK